MRAQAVAVTLVMLSAAACSSGPESSPAAMPRPGATTTAPSTPRPVPTTVYPGESWERDQRGDFRAVDDRLRVDGSTCVAVVKDGKLVHDGYWNGGAARKQQDVYSITKSLTSVLAGTFVQDGALDLDASASKQIAGWRGTAAEAVTVRDLLSMTSGRRSSEVIDRQMIWESSDKTAFALGVAQDHDPGEQWVYNNVAAQALEAVLDKVGRTDDVVDLARERLLGPLRMHDTRWDRDPAGNAVTYGGVTSTCRDLARVGYLMLRGGTWEDRQVLSPDYVRQATSPSSRLNAAFGLLWWTNAQGRIIDAFGQGSSATYRAFTGRLAPNAPPDTYWAFGSDNQYIAVVPSEGVVAVRLGERPPSQHRMTFGSFTSSILKALR